MDKNFDYCAINIVGLIVILHHFGASVYCARNCAPSGRAELGAVS
jgi:hypothetical protein